MIAGIAGSVKMGTWQFGCSTHAGRKEGALTLIPDLCAHAGKAVSIVVAGGYEDDDDMGDTFKYSGSGGTALSHSLSLSLSSR
jgi:hypothetical protein